MFFFFNDTATTEIYTLSLHDALPIYGGRDGGRGRPRDLAREPSRARRRDDGHRRIPLWAGDRKSTRLNSSHSQISYAVFCLKKKSRTRRTPSPLPRFDASTRERTLAI